MSFLSALIPLAVDVVSKVFAGHGLIGGGSREFQKHVKDLAARQLEAVMLEEYPKYWRGELAEQQVTFKGRKKGEPPRTVAIGAPKRIRQPPARSVIARKAWDAMEEKPTGPQSVKQVARRRIKEARARAKAEIDALKQEAGLGMAYGDGLAYGDEEY